MKNHFLLLIVGLGLAYGLMRTVHAPQDMISPGVPIPGHTEVAEDCFACHTPFRGATADKCIACHKVDEIGVKTTKGAYIKREKRRARFHQQLVESNCVACHSDHKGVKPFRPIKQFSHDLLNAELQKQCDSCHSKPEGKLHRRLDKNCGQCHSQKEWQAAEFTHRDLPDAVLKNCSTCHDAPRDDTHHNFKGECGSCHSMKVWKPADFKHDKLPQAELKQCQTCHETPIDAMHKNVAGKCESCHTQKAWTPATFEHSKYFRFDRRHRKDCDQCHTNDDYSQYTCYGGCHRHSERRIRGEHREEGIRNFEDCVECHRSGNEHEAKRRWRSRGDSADEGAYPYYDYYGGYGWGEREYEDDDD